MSSPDAPSTIDDSRSSTAGFADWVRPHWDCMVRFAQRLVGDDDAEDVVQDALAAAWRSRSRFDQSKGQARTWLLTIVGNQARNHLRRHRITRAVQHSVEEGAGAAGEGLVVSIDMARALARLTDRQRMAIALHYYCGLSISECAEVLVCSAGTVKSTLSDARGHLRSILGDDY
ncbi:MAG: RNA polymerase sigma factor [Mycobacterium sp.]|nr:RNA polymerase sigma factor [Mycobacterium sp.]